MRPYVPSLEGSCLHSSVPLGLSVAFYKGTRPGVSGLYNRLGRYLDRGPYSHCETVFSNGISGSSSYIDKGVRFKHIGFSSVGCWDFLPIPDPLGQIEAAAWSWMAAHEGMPYDVWGNLRFASNFARDEADKWFCSETTMGMFNQPDPYRWGPSGAATYLSHYFQSKILEV